MQPEGFSSVKRTNVTNKTEVHQVWHKRGKCPNGTIPIRRTAENLHNSSKDEPPSTCPLIHYAGIRADEHVLGARADINIWRIPRVMKNEWFLCSIKIISRMSSFIQYGWMEGPSLYNDHGETRLFVRSVDPRSGRDCFNLMCLGFVQVSDRLALGASLSPLSKYNGVQYDIPFQIHKDARTGIWWALYNEAVLGYWPMELLPVEFQGLSAWWGGEVCDRQNYGRHTRTTMGTGAYCFQGVGRCTYIHGMEVMDERRQWTTPHMVHTHLRPIDDPHFSYMVKWYNAGDHTLSAYFGGPGWFRPKALPRERIWRQPNPYRIDPYKISATHISLEEVHAI
ncbi:unnamed protein product [Alopecurus aequalis]